MIAKRWRNGILSVSLTRSRSTGELVPVTGRRCCPAPGCPFGMRGRTSARAEPVLHSTNFSPISDCGRIVQWASARNGANPRRSIFSTTTARLSLVTSRESTEPITAPAVFTSSPDTTFAALSKMARTR